MIFIENSLGGLLCCPMQEVAMQVFHCGIEPYLPSPPPRRQAELRPCNRNGSKARTNSLYCSNPTRLPFYKALFTNSRRYRGNSPDPPAECFSSCLELGLWRHARGARKRSKKGIHPSADQQIDWLRVQNLPPPMYLPPLRQHRQRDELYNGRGEIAPPPIDKCASNHAYRQVQNTCLITTLPYSPWCPRM